MEKENKVTYALTQDDLNRFAAMCAREGAKAYKVEQEKERKKKAKQEDKVRQTKKMLSSYRRLKAKLQDDDTEEFTEEEKIELRWKFLEDLMGSAKDVVTKTERTVIDTEKKLQEDRYCLHRIETAIKLYEEECNKTSSEEAKRRYREVYAMYIDDVALTVQEIAEIENVSEKTVYKDIGIACSIIAVYLLGM